ncbi:hypothetical protein [Mycobacterium nebraskense]|uniref:Uncharacterized protein n=1 Tax=Mycobacterium nebraskense TaxID=244292 RepID=A0A0F5NAY8_9MYCO|nr:hypothetical protein [Mycobacterium nebraskense]KKC04122.1 hypothetical protein WU83_15345 [Mycobacterium nebraskense]KLO39775.1 hypothetical protein ABW17_18745 [Mycobacterium nebraskense]MBI2693618.1 hypothetical protein [Mycobacterium nebraskense]MCV7116301.1 hypothetical protein [Mycobacterium nebraskense]ORW21714.1 hypothetical protein AWC17_06395 [Mycobacterium nebraskense]
MTASTPHYHRLRLVPVIFAGAATVALLGPIGTAHRPVRLTDVAVSPQTPPNLSGGGGFAADDDDDQAQLQQQLAQQQLQQSMQQAEQQNEQAEQQFEQSMQQAQLDEQQANNP